MQSLPEGRDNAELFDNVQEQMDVSTRMLNFIIERAHERGELVMETQLDPFREPGLFKPATFTEFEEWRSNYAIPRLVKELDKLQRMSERAQQLKGADHAR
jgi:hypothetical protein